MRKELEHSGTYRKGRRHHQVAAMEGRVMDEEKGERSGVRPLVERANAQRRAGLVPHLHHRW